jgi:hypothetical protein
MPVRYDKLVRDRIPEIIQAQGQHPVTRILISQLCMLQVGLQPGGSGLCNAERCVTR